MEKSKCFSLKSIKKYFFKVVFVNIHDILESKEEKMSVDRPARKRSLLASVRPG